MAKKTFKSIQRLREYSKHVAANILKNEVEPEAKKILIDAIRIAYGEYTSRADTPYERRYANGGLLDDRTIESYISSDGLSLRIRQEATSDTGGLLYVDVYVTRGDLYNWSNSEIYGRQPFPRDFYKYAQEMLEDKLPDIVQNAFKNKGIKTERISVGVRFK